MLLNPDVPLTAFDSTAASRIPEIPLPPSYLFKSLPAFVDNSSQPWFPGLKEQSNFASCYQYSGIVTTFGYELNRMLNRPGTLPENTMAAHFSWNFFNKTIYTNGVSVFQSFDVLERFGNPVVSDYGSNYTRKELGWPTGYQTYYNGMKNRLSRVLSIPTNTAEGILTLKHYLNDHLDGSGSGGVAFFSSSYHTPYGVLPPGTPEEGKLVIVDWWPWAGHGMCIVGYNDSIRYDRNGDGEYTNDLDINNDGKVDPKDWEIGGVIFANSGGTWWGNQGFGYTLYSSLATDYGLGGIWNNHVYIVEPNAPYEPVMTMKVNLDETNRESIRIRAGISGDTSKDIPEHILEFPIFNYQGGPHVMQGFDTVPGGSNMEIGFDITPLLSHVEPGKPAKFFLILDNKDPYYRGEGVIHSVSFLNYQTTIREYNAEIQNVPIQRNDQTVISATGIINFDKVAITTDDLASFQTGQPYSFQLQASGGMPPYEWSFLEPYREQVTDSVFEFFEGQKVNLVNMQKRYAVVPLPFPFRFFGRQYDTIYTQDHGVMLFTPEIFPFPWTCDEANAISQVPCIAPGFGLEHTFYWSSQFGIWVREGDGYFDVRWKVGRYLYDNLSVNNFMVRLYSDGRFEMRYGPIENIGFDYTLYRGVSKGDEVNYWASSIQRFDDMEGKAFLYYPPEVPSGIEITREGLLTVENPDTSAIYSVPVKVTDKQNVSDTRTFSFSASLSMTWNPDISVIYNHSVPVDITVKNTGNSVLSDLKINFIAGSERLVFSDTTETITSLDPGSSVTLLPAFSVILNEDLPDGTTFLTTIRAVSGQRSWTQTLPLIVGAPLINLLRVDVEDGYNNKLDPGEIGDLVVLLGNKGSEYAGELSVYLEPSDTLVTVLSGNTYEAELFRSGQSLKVPFRVKASQYARHGETASINILIGQEGYPRDTIPFTLMLGTPPVALISFAANDATQTIEMLLDSLDVPFEIWDTIPKANLSDYHNLFLFLGSTNSVSLDLTDQQGDYFSKYLEPGNNLYLESYRFWGLSPSTRLNSMFRYTPESVPVYDYSILEGVAGTLADSMHFYHTFPGSQSSMGMVPSGESFPLFKTENLPEHVTTFADSSGNYRTIGTMTGFEYLLGGDEPSTRITLLKRYLEFFGYNFEQLYPLFHTDNRDINKNDTVQFNDDSFRDIVFRRWEFPGGSPSVSEEENPMVIYSEPGSFDVSLFISNGINERSITKKNYIRVSFPEGTEDTTPEQPFLIYPNPVKDILFLKSLSNINEELTITIYDLYGRSLLSKEIPGTHNGETHILNISILRQGFYVVRISGGIYRQMTKVIKTY